MEFGIGLVVGAALTGFGVRKGGAIFNVVHRWLSNAEAKVKQKMDAKVASLKSKL